MKPDTVKPVTGADAKGFAVFSDGVGSEMEGSYSISKATGRGQGICIDNGNNTYRLVFE